MLGVADSIIIGFLASRVLPAHRRRRITESVLISLFALGILAGHSARRP